MIRAPVVSLAFTNERHEVRRNSRFCLPSPTHFSVWHFNLYAPRSAFSASIGPASYLKFRYIITLLRSVILLHVRRINHLIILYVEFSDLPVCVHHFIIPFWRYS